MGFCYEGRKLVCDKCNKAGARKVRCPFNACPSIALCPECRKLHKALTSKAGHRAYGCERAADKYRAADEHAARLRAEGKFLRVAAMGVDLPLKDGRTVHAVHVIFRGAAGAEKGFYMSPETRATQRCSAKSVALKPTSFLSTGAAPNDCQETPMAQDAEPA